MTMAIDRSGGPHEGEIYMQGPSNFGFEPNNKIVVFRPPVPIPDITPEANDIGHKNAVMHAEIGTAGGPPVTECRLQWGPTVSYGNFTPCSPSTPYGADTKVSIELSGLHVERNYHYRFLVKNANGQNLTKDAVFHTHAVLALSTDPASNFTRTAADLNASFDPDGMSTQYYFDWGATQNYTDRTPVMEVPASSGVEQVPPATLTSLQPGHSYHYRAVATNSLGTTLGPDRVFTVPAKPRVSGVDATNLTSTTAELDARLNGFGADTTYQWEYGITPLYGSTTPKVDIGSSETDQKIADSVEGLQPGVLYHFRLVAENEWGTTRTSDATFSFFPPDCPNSHIRQETGGNYLPDCRAYELVSPERAGGAVLFPGDIYKRMKETEGFSFPASYFSAAPNALGLATGPPRFGFFAGIGAIPGLHPPNAFIDRYVATRTTSGWVTTYPGTTGDKTINLGRLTCSMSMDLCLDYKTAEAFFGGQKESKAPSLYDVIGNYLGRLPTNLALVPDGEHKISDAIPSADFSHYVFVSRTPFAQGGLDHPPGSVYDNDIELELRSGRLRSPRRHADPVGAEQRPQLRPRPTSCRGHLPRRQPHPDRRADDARMHRSFFEPCPDALAFPTHLYMRVNNATTYDVSKGTTVNFLGMTRDGETVDFSTPLQLLPQDTDGSVDIYQWKEHTDSLSLLTQGNGAGDTDACNASWTSNCDVQPLHTERPDLDNTFAQGNGDIYFYSPEQLDPENPGVHNERNLYVYRNGKVQYVTTLDSGTTINRHADLAGRQPCRFRDPFPGDRLRQRRLGGDVRLQPGNGDHRLRLLPALRRTADHRPPDAGAGQLDSRQGRRRERQRAVHDGRRPGRLLDLGGPRPARHRRAIDVYEFVGDRAHLITSGTETRVRVEGALFFPGQLTGFEGFSADGADLFFSTYDTLVPQDHNGQFVKFYDARSGGGFPAEPASLPCPAADECHGDGSTAPPPLGIGSQAALGGGSGAPPSEPRKPKHHGKRHPSPPQGPAPRSERPREGYEMRMKIAWLTGLAALAMLLTVCDGAQAKRVGIRSFEVESSTSQAGGHPDVRFYATFDNRNVENGEFAEPEFGTCFCHDVQQVDTHFPTGFIGNPHAVPECTLGEFSNKKCSPDTQVGVLEFQGVLQLPIYNVEPHPGQPGLLAFPLPILNAPGFIDLHARTGSDYGLDATTVQIFHFLPISNLDVHIWGVPASPAHDYNRQPSPQTGCFATYTEPCPGAATSNAPETPYLENPTSCGARCRGASTSPTTTTPFTTPKRRGRRRAAATCSTSTRA